MRKILDLRTTDLSLYHYMSTKLTADDYVVISGHNYDYVTSGVFLVDGYPSTVDEMSLPTVAIEHSFTTEEPFQLGPGRTDNRRFAIDVFARTDGERDDLSERIRNYLSMQNISIYDYNIVLTGGTSDVIATARPENIVITTLRSDRPVQALQHAMEVSFELHVDVSSGYSLIT